MTSCVRSLEQLWILGIWMVSLKEPFSRIFHWKIFQSTIVLWSPGGLRLQLCPFPHHCFDNSGSFPWLIFSVTLKEWWSRTFQVVQWLRLCASWAGVQSLVRELRSHMQPKKKKKNTPRNRMISWSQYILGNHGSKKVYILLKFASLSKEQK